MSDARTILFRRLIDDAGLFPPARKPLAKAIADHRQARGGPAAWILGRFLCPAGRLEELRRATDSAAAGSRPDWELGAIAAADGDDWRDSLRAQLRQIGSFDGPGEVSAVELPLPAARPAAETIEIALAEVADAGLGDRDLFLELTAPTEPDLDALAEAGRGGGAGSGPGAKLRCGGSRASSVPDDTLVARFIAACRRLRLPFKATAGLHHPFRERDPETGALQHGFVNLLAAAALRAEGDGEPTADELAGVIAERDPAVFAIGPEGIAWRQRRAGAEAIAAARGLFTAYGSCSFSEPLQGLAAHGVLPGELVPAEVDA